MTKTLRALYTFHERSKITHIPLKEEKEKYHSIEEYDRTKSSEKSKSLHDDEKSPPFHVRTRRKSSQKAQSVTPSPIPGYVVFFFFFLHGQFQTKEGELPSPSLTKQTHCR